MRALASLLALVLLLLLPIAGQADDAGNKSVLDQLFAELKNAPDSDTADAITAHIWIYWMNPADPVLAGRMSDIAVATGNGDTDTEMKLLDQLIIDYPNYAEGWNQRATLEYVLGDLDASLADIEKVLALEPRHFGALAGRVMIYLRQGKRNLALRDMMAALSIHPFLSEKQLFPELSQNVTHV